MMISYLNKTVNLKCQKFGKITCQILIEITRKSVQTTNAEGREATFPGHYEVLININKYNLIYIFNMDVLCCAIYL